MNYFAIAIAETILAVIFIYLYLKEKKLNIDWESRTVATEHKLEECLEIINDLKKFKESDVLCIENESLRKRNRELEMYVEQVDRFRLNPPPPEVFINNDTIQLG